MKSRIPTLVALSGFAVITVGCSSPYAAPPDTSRGDVVDTLHGVALPDPYRWLEDQESPETRAWIDEQNAYAEEIVGQTALREQVHQVLLEFMDQDDIGSPRGGGDFEYFTMRRAGEELPIIYRRPKPPEGELRRIDPAMEYEMVLDPHGESPENTTRYGIHAISGDGKYMIYNVRDGGADELELRLRDLESGIDLPDRYPRALYGGASFNDDETGFYYVHRSRQTGPRAYFHTIGTTREDDRLVWGEAYDPTSFIGLTQAENGRLLVLTAQHGWVRNEVYLHDTRTGVTTTIVPQGTDALFNVRYTDGELYMRTNLDAPNYRVVAVDPARPQMEHWRDVIPENEDVLLSYTTIDDRYYVNYLDDVSTKIRVFESDGSPAGEVAVPDDHTASIRSAGEGKAFLTVNGLTTPETVYLLDLASGEREVWEEPGVTFDADAVELRQVWYTSQDGTRVPMYVMHRADIALDGSHPTLLYGYGGFNVPTLPRFSTTAAAWLEFGGVYAVANMRGGGEFGETWHRAGMLENKQNVFDDFIAAAEWLIESGYTSAERLAIRGGSNGGLLVGAALTQRPELFRAVLCGFPDLDMVRFFRFTDANNMPALLEYGDASDPDQFVFLRAHSPYENVREGTSYPAVMFTTGDLDTRVPPLQARKMTAKLQHATSSGLPVVLHYDPKGGHAGNRGRPMSRVIDDSAMELTFLLSQLGVEAHAALN